MDALRSDHAYFVSEIAVKAVKHGVIFVSSPV
jgi:hypothetical protein